MAKLDLNLLVALDALLDEANVSRAAARLGMSQPALSHALARLRDVMGDPLFVRSRNGMAPTPRAEAMHAGVKDILRRAETAFRPPAFKPSEATGRFAVATTDYMAMTLLVPLIGKLRTLAPGLLISVASLTRLDAEGEMSRGSLDLVVTAADLADDRLERLSLYTDRYVGAARAGHPLRSVPVTADALCQYDHALVSPARLSEGGPIDHALAALGKARRVAVVLPSFLLLPPLLASTDLVAAAPKRLFSFGTDAIGQFELPLRLDPIEIIAIWHPRYSLDPRHIWMRELLVRLAGS